MNSFLPNLFVFAISIIFCFLITVAIDKKLFFKKETNKISKTSMSRPFSKYNNMGELFVGYTGSLPPEQFRDILKKEFPNETY